jgi:acetyl esterase/lipase
MYSGLALLMDVHHAAKPNGYGIIYVSGSGWHSPLDLNAEPIKGNAQSKLYAAKLVEAGYTVFSVNHRAAPRFRYPSQVEDVQRAVRFVRHNAEKYRIRPDRLGAVGGSSGGHLVSMLGALDGRGDPDAADPVNRASAKVQCVVARAGVFDLSKINQGAVVSMMGSPENSQPALFREASPVTHVTPDDPPVLLMHGDKDSTVPFAQSEIYEAALRKAGVAVKLIRVAGGEHGPTFGNSPNPPDYMGEMIGWLDRYLPPPQSSGAAGRVLFDNAYCRVVFAANTPGQKSRRHRHAQNRVMIHLDAGKMRLAFDDGVVNDVSFRPGNVRWDPSGGYHTSENIGGTYYRIVEIEVKQPGIAVQFPEKDPPRADPERYAVELDTPQVRIVRARYAPRAAAPVHRHELPRVIVALTEQAVKLTLPDGSVRELRNPAGQVVFSGEPAEHSETNLLDQLFEAVVVEFKAK